MSKPCIVQWPDIGICLPAQGTEAVGGLDHAQIDPSFANANYQGTHSFL